jgi:NAD+ diphosphatase
VKDSSELHTNFEVDKYAWFTRDEARANIRPDSLAEYFLVSYLDE